MTTNNLNQGNSGHFELNQHNNQNNSFNLNSGINTNYYSAPPNYYYFPFADTWLTAYPEVNVVVNKNRKKKFIDKVYLDELQEFELEIFNPSTSKLGILIEMNGSLISQNHLVINPGQRINLERFIDSDKKFVFSIYEVDNTADTKNAIQNNGIITLHFYKEEYIQNYNISFPNITYCNSSPVIDTTANYVDWSSVTPTINNVGNKVETGRIEEGSKSNQLFKQTNGNFSLTKSYTETLQLLPNSQKPLEAKDLIKYCTKCNTKLKKEWKFCSTCGTPTNADNHMRYMKISYKSGNNLSPKIFLLEDFNIKSINGTFITYFNYDEVILRDKDKIDYINVGTLEDINQDYEKHRQKEFILKKSLEPNKIEFIS